MSSKFTYDEVNELIKPKIKPQRRLIVFIDLPKENQSNDYLINLFKEGGFDTHIDKIESGNEIFTVYFNNEENTKSAFTWLEEHKEKNVN
jgi:hypothetical protein